MIWRALLLVYADASIILVSDKDPRVVSRELSKDLESCNHWLIDHQLSLHVGKTECILFGSHVKLKRASDFKIKYNEQDICPQDCINYLGVTIDQLINMVDSVGKKAIGRLQFLYRYSSSLKQSLRKKKCVLHSYNVILITAALPGFLVSAPGQGINYRLLKIELCASS